MEEFNKKTLIEALSSLKEHEPPDAIWGRIDQELELGENELYQQQTLHNLPDYDPPEKVWKGILGELQEPVKIKRLQIKWRQSLVVAASLSIVVAAYFLLQTALEPVPDESEIAVHYSVEKVDDLLLKKDWKDDQESFEMYLEMCDAKKYICEHPEFQVLQREFDELSQAIEEIESVLGEYSTDPNLITQIKEIELERTDIFKKMMVMLI